MTLANFYLVCFLVGLLLSVLSLLLGQLDIDADLPDADLDGLDLDAGDADSGHHASGEASPINFATATAFLAWFGGTGYLLERYSAVWSLIGAGVAITVGLAGAWVVLWVMRLLITKEENMDPMDYEMVGVLGRVVSPIREGGTGELVYVQGGTRHTAGARSEDGTAIPRDEEVVVTRYEKGLAYVRRWEELSDQCAPVDTERAQQRLK